MPGLPRHLARMASASLASQTRSGFRSLSPSFLVNFSSNQRPGVFARLGGERAVNLPVILRHEFLNAVLTLDKDRQRRRLHPADGGEVKPAGLRVEGGHGAGAVDADQPVGFGTADRRVGQRTHGRVVAQLRKAFADGGGRHGLQPKAFDGLCWTSRIGRYSGKSAPPRGRRRKR